MAVFSRELQTGLEGRYRVALAWRYETVEFLGLPYLSDERPLTLQEIYVPLSLTWSAGSNERLYVPEALEQSRHLVVLGDPGAGKSTLVKLLAYSFGRIEPTPLARRLGPHLPVPIILRDYRTRQWHTPEDMLRDFVAQLDDDIRSEVRVDWLLAALREGRGILLLDGLDEVGSREERQRLRDQVVAPLLVHMPKSLAVLTSRIVGYEEVPLDIPIPATGGGGLFLLGFRRCYVAPFNDEDIDQFITRWYTARERDERERQRRLVSLREALRRSDRIRRLAGNPSLLTLMALIHRVTAELPSGRVKLYDKIVEAYLETIQRYRGLTTYEASLEQMKRWLAAVGWQMQSRRASSQEGDLLVSRQDILEWLSEAIAVDRPSASEEAEKFLEYIARRSGLLIPRGPEQFAFVHLTFQEYFATWYLRGLLRRFDTLADMCAERVVNVHWQETLVLLFELLAEFPGAGDDLVDELTKRVHDEETRRGTAALFAALVLDEQSGLSRHKQEQAVHFALAAACDSYNEAVVEHLQHLTPERFDTLMRPWLDQRLHQASPETIGQDFFLTAPQFNRYRLDWPQKLATWVAQRGSLMWSDQQVADVVASSRGNLEICAWAGARLPFVVWLRDQEFEPDSLAALNMSSLLLIQNQSPKHRLLAQLSVVYAVSRSHILPHLCLFFIAPSKATALPLPRAPVRARAQVPAQSWVPVRAWAPDWILAWARTQARAHSLALGLALALAVSLESPEWLLQTQGLATDVAWAEWLFGAPDAPPDTLQTHLDALEKLAAAPDDWTRLLGLTGLMLLGEGTPQRCAERNALLDRGMQHAATFTFPADVRDVTDTAEFHREFPELLQVIFLHTPGEPWLQPEWFDPDRPEARFFRARPREFFARAAEVLDPEGKTELARWRQTK